MNSVLDVVGPNHSLQLFGVKLVGVNRESGTKVLLTLALLALLWALGYVLRAIAKRMLARHDEAKIHFWTRQGVQLSLTLVLLVGLLSIWFDDPARLSTGLGLVTAGLAFALQKVVASLAAYLIILRGRTFNVGDRITMGGVRGDVIALGFMQTTILEMGQPPPVQNAEPAMWIQARQYTGRIVTVSNSKIFDEPVFNYSREFPYLWEEMMLPIAFGDDRDAVEKILLAAAEKHSLDASSLGADVARELERRYLVDLGDLKPRVFLRITDNWVELTVRFLVRDRLIRETKDAMSRQILQQMEAAKIGIASSTFAVVAMPPLQIHRERADRLR